MLQSYAALATVLPSMYLTHERKICFIPEIALFPQVPSQLHPMDEVNPTPTAPGSLFSPGWALAAEVIPQKGSEGAEWAPP